MATYSYETLREVRLNISDRSEPYEFEDTDLNLFLTRASGNVNGGSAYALQAWAVKEARSWTSANVGGVSRSKTNPADALLKLAHQYAAQSGGTAILDDTSRPAFGVARVDWQEHLRDTDLDLSTVADPSSRRIRSEDLED